MIFLFKIISKLLKPGDLRDNLTRYIYRAEEVKNAGGLIEATFLKVVACADTEKKLERAIRKGVVRRYHGMNCISDAVEKKVLSEEEGKLLKEMEELVSEAIVMGHFDPDELVRKPNPKQSASLNVV